MAEHLPSPRSGPRLPMNMPRVLDLVKDMGVEKEMSQPRRTQLWTEVARKYNEQLEPNGQDHYDAISLKKAWNNLKARVRKKRSHFVKELKKTGGGPVPNDLNAFSKDVLAEIGDAKEFQSLFDSESAFDEEVKAKEQTPSEVSITQSQSQSTEPTRHQFQKHIQWPEDFPVKDGRVTHEKVTAEESIGGEYVLVTNEQEFKCHATERETSLWTTPEPLWNSTPNHDSTITFRPLMNSQTRILNDNSVNSDVTLPSTRSRSRSPSVSQEMAHQNGESTNRRSRTRGGKRARAPTTLAGQYIETRSEMEANYRTEEHKMRKEILQLEIDAAKCYKKTMEEKAAHVKALNKFEMQKALELGHFEVAVAKYRVRREKASALKAEREVGIWNLDPNISLDYSDV